ncbi:hypothetical protein RI129_002471 [Pyrocoelia pectoralis]|uniref:Adenosine kinase n=1 Tax=Pyrocoelia pectoralis TaxID=417401 RepID=A0AAN7VNY6_9COLE
MIKHFPQNMWEFAQTSDILFGNRREYKTLINNVGLTLSVENFVKNLCQNYKNQKNTACGKIVIVTNGQDYVMCAHSGGTVEVLDVPKIDKNRFKDSNGAGDAFAAGFLAGLLFQKEPLTSMKWGCWVAQQIIQQQGCTIPHYSADILKEIH